MTTQSTSREAYHHLVRNNLLKGKQARCLDKLITMGGATSGEVLDALGIKNVNAWRARFTELSGRGLIVEVTQRKCKISGLVCIVWEATNRTKPLDRKRGHRVDGKAWKALALEAISELEQYEPKGGKAREFRDRATKLAGTP